jgi:hypothetical protein
MSYTNGLFADILGTLYANGFGSDTIINGYTVQGTWCDADLSRVSRFIDDNDLGSPVYEVVLEPFVLDAPYNIRAAKEIIDARRNYKAVIRKVITPADQGSADAFVHVVCVVVPR